METPNKFTTTMENIISNNYFHAILAIITIVYVSAGHIKLPPFVVKLFKNNIFRLVFLSLLLVYRFDNAPHVAFLVSLIFLMTMHYIGQTEMMENMAYLEHFCDRSGKFPEQK